MRQRIVTICLVLLVTGCGSKWIYNNSDWFAVQYIENYINLDELQQGFIRKSISASIPWHREEEIPVYLNHLNELAVIDPKTFSLEQLQAQQVQFKQHSIRLYEHFSPQIVTLISGLSDMQTEQFMDYLRVKHVQRKQKYQEFDEQQFRQRFKKNMTETLEEWIGPLSKEQKQLVERWSQERHVTLPMWFDYQTRMRIELNRVFGERTNKRDVKESLDRWVYRTSDYYPSQLAQRVEENTQLGKRYLVALINIMSDSQQAHFDDELAYWRELLQDLT